MVEVTLANGTSFFDLNNTITSKTGDDLSMTYSPHNGQIIYLVVKAI